MTGVYRIYPKRKKNFFSSMSINTILIAVNVILFLIFFNQGFIEKFIALDPFYILNGSFLWTFLTSMFMHANFLHLFVNMFSLMFVGSLVEKILGPKRYFWFYLLSGLFAGLFFVLAYLFAGNLNLHVPAVGASGALFGLIGFLMLVTPNLPVYVMFIPIPIKMKYAAPGMLIILWLISRVGNIPIGNAAHLGGLIAGLGYGLYLRKAYKNKIRLISRHFS
ncbi:rhomboid family intramembrane serine protease [Candidatus Pacearchaeota archaeon]|nr:rhomboid family intramembrane serine protease [Candidatus Pacearchaeota archaeon]